ncbi:MAG TPA: aminopeptidase [Actinomycetota bacterium]|nr:aminopeptidase [Actinomycetota bacterium]
MLEVDKFANLLAGYCVEVESGMTVLVNGPAQAEPLFVALQAAILEKSAWPLLRPRFAAEGDMYLRAASGEQLESPSPADLASLEKVDRVIDIGWVTPHLAEPPPSGLVEKFARSRAQISRLLRSRPYCITFWPTEYAAERAGMSLPELEEFVAQGLFLGADDPAAEWVRLRETQQRIADRLMEADELRIEAEGTDLSLRVGGRTWINSDGKRNMPSGEVFTGPIENSVNGVVRFSIPASPPRMSVPPIVGITLRFKDGVVTEATADEGEELLLKMLDTDDGSRLLGEVGIGTNFGIDRAIGVTLFDEKIGGTIHLALGQSYPETGGLNTSLVHWDLICDLRPGGRLTADGTPLQENGKFLF